MTNTRASCHTCAHSLPATRDLPNLFGWHAEAALAPCLGHQLRCRKGSWAKRNMSSIAHGSCGSSRNRLSVALHGTLSMQMFHTLASDERRSAPAAQRPQPSRDEGVNRSRDGHAQGPQHAEVPRQFDRQNVATNNDSELTGKQSQGIIVATVAPFA